MPWPTVYMYFMRNLGEVYAMTVLSCVKAANYFLMVGLFPGDDGAQEQNTNQCMFEVL